MGGALNVNHTIFLLHPLGGNAETWQFVADRILPARCHAVDLPGFGINASHDAFSCEQMVHHVIDQIAHVRPSSFSLIGHSMGGKIASIVAHMAESGHHQLTGLTDVVLIAASPISPEPIPDDKRVEMLSWAKKYHVFPNQIAETFLIDNTSAPLTDEMFSIMKDAITSSNPDAWAAWLNTGSREDWSERIGTLYTRCLVVAGVDDGPLGVDGQQQLNMTVYANASFAVVENAAHLIPQEQPDASALLILDFLNIQSDWSDQRPDYLALLNSGHTSARTRAIHRDRLPVPERAMLKSDQRRMLGVLCGLILPQPTGLVLDLARRVEAAIGKSDGWRFADLPADETAFTEGLTQLNDLARSLHSSGFGEMGSGQQDDLLQRVAQGDLALSQKTGFNLTHWFEDLRAAVVKAYVSHPATMARIGYDGFANGGDGVRLGGYQKTASNDVEHWHLMLDTGDLP